MIECNIFNHPLVAMMLQKTTFERLFPAAPSGAGFLNMTSFGFESNLKRHFVVTVPGSPKIEQGMTVIALLENPNDWSSDSFLGWVNCSDGSLVFNNPGKLLGMGLLNLFFAIMFQSRAYVIIASPSNANLIAFLVTLLFSGLALHFFYLSVKAFLVRRTLVAVWDIVRPVKSLSP